jgi:hypothetical protein
VLSRIAFFADEVDGAHEGLANGQPNTRNLQRQTLRPLGLVGRRVCQQFRRGSLHCRQMRPSPIVGMRYRSA